VIHPEGQKVKSTKKLSHHDLINEHERTDLNDIHHTVKDTGTRMFQK
jgi:hypothetical protein